MTSGQVNQASGALLQVTTDCAQSTQSVATGDTSPLGQVPFISRAVTRKEASGQLGQVAIAVGRPGWLTQPVAHEHEALFGADKWPANSPRVVRMSSGAEVRLIPPVVYFVPFALSWALQQWRPWTIPGGAASSVAGLAMVVSGIALMLWSIAAMWRANTTVIPWEQVSAIVGTGPFRFSRNPIYLADAITYVGGSLLIHSWWPLLLLPGIVVMMRRMVIDREERYLTERFGDAYREYQLRVGRWI